MSYNFRSHFATKKKKPSKTITLNLGLCMPCCFPSLGLQFSGKVKLDFQKEISIITHT